MSLEDPFPGSSKGSSIPNIIQEVNITPIADFSRVISRQAFNRLSRKFYLVILYTTKPNMCIRNLLGHDLRRPGTICISFDVIRVLGTLVLSVIPSKLLRVSSLSTRSCLMTDQRSSRGKHPFELYSRDTTRRHVPVQRKQRSS